MKMKWYSVKKFRPIDGCWVLICHEGYHGGEMCWYENGEFRIKNVERTKRIYVRNARSLCTHWMYFPTPAGLVNLYDYDPIKITLEEWNEIQSLMNKRYVQQ